MHAVKVSNGRDNVLGFVTDWWRNLMGRRAAIEELNCCGADEAAHIARDVGVSAAELRTLAGKWPDRTDLLSRRIAAIGLDADHIQAKEPQVMRDLQRVCSQCAGQSRCERDLNRENDQTWRDYCPNAATLSALRTEDRDERLLRRKRKWRSF